jgi:hypothetical protein
MEGVLLQTAMLCMIPQCKQSQGVAVCSPSRWLLDISSIGLAPNLQKKKLAKMTINPKVK